MNDNPPRRLLFRRFVLHPKNHSPAGWGWKLITFFLLLDSTYWLEARDEGGLYLWSLILLMSLMVYRIAKDVFLMFFSTPVDIFENWNYSNIRMDDDESST